MNKELFSRSIGLLGEDNFNKLQDKVIAIFGLGGVGGTAVYGTIFLGKDAYGIIEPSAESLEIIVKQRGSAGTADPLDQRGTIGWKMTTGQKILYQERMVRVESGSYYGDVDEAN